MAEQSKVYRPDETAVVVMVPRPEPAAPADPFDPRLRGRPRPVGGTDPAEISVYDIGSSYRAAPTATEGAPRFVSSFTEISHEMSGAGEVPPGDLVLVRDAQLGQLARVTVSGSGREIWSAVRFGAGSAETDGTATTLTYQRVDAGEQLTRQVLVSATTRWSPKVPTALRLADIDAEIDREGPDSPARQSLLEARAAYDAEKYEVWDPLSESRIRREGTARPQLLDGRYRLGVESVRHYQPLAPTDDYRATSTANATGPVAPWPEIQTGPLDMTRIELFLAPQIYRFTLQWAALYEIGTLFFSSTVAIPKTVVYRDRLPFFPFAYQFQGPPNPVLNPNDGAISYSARFKLAYRRALAEDEAYQQFTPFFYIILIGRIGGRWLITQLSLPVDTLCAVVYRSQNGGARAPTYIWRRTALVRPFVPIDFGQLNTPEVLGFGILDSDIFDNGSIIPLAA